MHHGAPIQPSGAPDPALVVALERRAVAAWPAAEDEDLDGWRLRSMHGVSRRANSVWAGPSTSARSLAVRIADAERWYGARGRPPVFQVSPLAEPGLEAALETRGYRVDAPVWVCTAHARAIAPVRPRPAGRPTASAGAGARPAGITAEVDRAPSAAWLEVAAVRGRYGATTPVYEGLLARLGPRARFALARIDGAPASAGLGVVDAGWLGVFSMHTLAEARCRGGATAVLGALATAAIGEAIERLYLLVERENHAASSLYAKTGFRALYGYHYRVA